jgi:hypothetical protein
MARLGGRKEINTKPSGQVKILMYKVSSLTIITQSKVKT